MYILQIFFNLLNKTPSISLKRGIAIQMSNLARTIHKNEEIESGTALISKKIPVMLVPFFEGSDYTLEQTSNKIALIK